MIRTDDPIADFAAHEAERERAMKGLPVCCECHKPIQTEELYEVDNCLYCPDCMLENHMQLTENYIREP